jgi:hypothetical protein
LTRFGQTKAYPGVENSHGSAKESSVSDHTAETAAVHGEPNPDIHWSAGFTPANADLISHNEISIDAPVPTATVDFFDDRKVTAGPQAA